ncbi:MAG: hypothetical protein H0U55_16875, partial [Rubrobacteraceae bacterium]|nr:hypothetical protein [Rubrobacteraceae bacterium]
ECGHPEMRRLPDGTYHCPACGSEVLPPGASPVDRKPEEHSKAYWAGWLDGRVGAVGSFADNRNLARFEEASERLDYYRGHRAGREAGLVRAEAPLGERPETDLYDGPGDVSVNDSLRCSRAEDAPLA